MQPPVQRMQQPVRLTQPPVQQRVQQAQERLMHLLTHAKDEHAGMSRQEGREDNGPNALAQRTCGRFALAASRVGHG